MKVKVSREAAIELEEAAAWYEEEQVGLGERLIGAFEDALKRLGSPNPPLTPISGKASQFEMKRLILRRFPPLGTQMNEENFKLAPIKHYFRLNPICITLKMPFLAGQRRADAAMIEG